MPRHPPPGYRRTPRVLPWGWRGRSAALLTVALAACGGPTPPDDEPPPPPPPTDAPAITVVTAPDSAHAGDAVAIRIALTRGSAPEPDATVTLTVLAGGGSLDAATVATDADGMAAFTWRLGREAVQELEAVAGEATATITVRTPPVLATLDVAATDVTVTDLGTAVDLGVDAKDRDGFVIPVPGDVRVEVISTAPAVARLPVLGSTARHDAVGITGPGTAEVRAVRGTIVSPSVTISVAPALAIIGALEAPAVVEPGTVLALTGYRLDLLPTDAVAIGGTVAPPTRQVADRLEFAAPTRNDFGVCAGTAVTPVTVQGGLTPPNLRVRYRRDGELALAIGEAHLFGAPASDCFAVAPGAEYLLLFADTRLITGAVTQAEDDDLRRTAFPVSVGSVAPSTGIRSVRGSPIGGSPNLQSDILPATPPSASTADDYFRNPRTAPWAVGDGITIDLFDNGVFLQPHGRIVQVSPAGRVAVAVLDRDDSYNVEGRLDIDEALAMADGVTIPLLDAAFALPNRPETTPGTGQVLFVVAGLDGGPVDGAAISDWILIGNAFVRTAGVPIPLQPFVAAHELAHIYQFAHTFTLCSQLGICQAVPRSHWGFEGGAEYLAQESMRLAKGVPETANQETPLFLYGSFAYFACCTPFGSGATFGEGYAGASWFIRDLVGRVEAAGLDFTSAVGVVSRGAVEGWYGRLFPSGGTWPGGGLSARLEPYLGVGWDIVGTYVHAAASLALDDRVPAASGFSIPATRDSWQDLTLGPEARVTAGSGERVSAQSFGTGFAWALLDDQDLGGAYDFSAGAPDVQWLLVRLR